jgi:hypothetical protein
MRDMIEARVQLRNVTRAFDGRAEGVDEAVRADVTRRVNHMEQYLDRLTGEFRDNYKTLSDKQRGYEKRASTVLKRYAEADTIEEPPQLPGFVWGSLSSLPMLADLIGKGCLYKNGFEDQLDKASELLRNEHARILRSKGGMLASGT